MSLEWPSFDDDEINAVKSVLTSGKVNYWTGTQGVQFETEFAKFSDVKHAVCIANGTLALEVALLALGIGTGDEVIVTSRSFFASVSSIVRVGAKPVFADIDCETQNLDPAKILSLVTPRTKAIMCVHLAGWPCDMYPILEIAKKNKLRVIEDCAQAHGAKYRGRPVGSIGDVGCWSFCQDKIITTGGEGGMITTNSEAIWKFVWTFKDHGKSYSAVNSGKGGNSFKWLHDSIGSNYRLTEMQAAIGRIQLGKLKSWTAKRKKNAEAIRLSAKSNDAFRVPHYSCEGCDGNCDAVNGCVHANYKVYLSANGNVEFRDQLLAQLNEADVPCFTGSCPEMYLEKACVDLALNPSKRLTNAKKIGEESLMFLCHPTIKRKKLNRWAKIISGIKCA